MAPIRQTRWYRALRAFFFPSPGAPRWRRALPYLVVMAIVAAGALLAAFTWRYTNSNEFCGTFCHTIMYPSLAAYQQSTHTRVNCVECHMGRDALREQLPRKTTHIGELYALITNSYERPLKARRLYPARITCELCHYPPQFFDDTLQEIRHYAEEDLQAIEGLEKRYAEQYAPAYGAFREEIRQAIQVLKDIYQRNFFPEQGGTGRPIRTTWDT